MSQKKFKKLRKLAREMQKHAHSGTQSLPEAFTQDGRRVLNPGKPKGTYRWLKKNVHLARQKTT
jgi:hypothetical protein